jgi:thiol-disulfide isomerase/thioredoxin
MKRILHTTLIIASFGMSHAQDSIHISGQFLHNARFAKVVVKKFNVGSMDIAAVPIQANGRFSIAAPKDLEAGVYRFQYSQSANEFVDIILNGTETNIYFEIDVEVEASKRFPVFTHSEENKAYYTFKKEVEAKHDLIAYQHQYLSGFPTKPEASYAAVLKVYNKNVEAYQKMLAQFIEKTPFFWVKQLARYSNAFFPTPTEHWRLQQYTAHQNFWMGKPTHDERLLNSPLYTDAILDFVQYYMNAEVDFTEEEKEVGYQRAIDTIVARFAGNERLHQFAITYLQLGFKEIGNEKALQYLDEKYALLLTKAAEDTALAKRLAAYERLGKGQIAPNFKWATALGDSMQLADFKGNEVLLVFWSSDCPHCLEELPLVQKWAEAHTGTLILAVNVDEDKNRHLTEASKYSGFFHLNDYKGIKGAASQAYSIFATPTFFRIDKEQKIRQKYEKFSPNIE